jgi:hypothetical protein
MPAASCACFANPYGLLVNAEELGMDENCARKVKLVFLWWELFRGTDHQGFGLARELVATHTQRVMDKAQG